MPLPHRKHLIDLSPPLVRSERIVTCCGLRGHVEDRETFASLVSNQRVHYTLEFEACTCRRCRKFYGNNRGI